MFTRRDRDADEPAQGHRLGAGIRSSAHEVSEDALFPGHDTDPADGQGLRGRSAFSEDELRAAYDAATRRATEWYRSSLSGSTTAPHPDRTEKADVPAT